MNNLISILLQSSISIALLFTVYYAFLRKDTFFKTNRLYLIASLMLSVLIPFIDFSFLMPAREQVYLVLLDPLVISSAGIQASVSEHMNLYQIGAVIYLTGAGIFFIRFIFQLMQLFLLINKFGISRREGMRIVFTNMHYSPFSFFNLVFLNTEDIDSPESQKIIAHERVHIRQAHSIDLILLEIITIIQWFNPFIWFYRHALKTLHEYLADEGVLHSGVDTKVYHALLFKQSTGIQINDLTNNFSKSLIKKRFIMMTKKRTTRFARVKLLFALPLAMSMILLISYSPDMIAQTEEQVPPPPPKKSASVEKSDQKPVKNQAIEHQDEEAIFTVVEEMPKFPGDKSAMYKYLGENIKYPDVAKKEGIQGTVFVTFVIEKDGKVSHVKLLRGVHESLDKEAIRVVESMPKWEPGKQKGQAVRVQYNLPVKYALGEDNAKEKEK